RKIYEALERREFEAIPSYLDRWVEWHFPDADGLWFAGTHNDPRLFVETVLRPLDEHFQQFEMKPGRMTRVGDRVILAGRVRGRARGGGRLSAAYAQVWYFQGAKVCRVDEFHDRAAWLSALGRE
ncbi:MAG: nuclear transport factor 2 family protein, partial [Chloroflexi bacterium]|nr:nuclear transport factor 2 family protein [Chloroflexota bacterium]